MPVPTSYLFNPVLLMTKDEVSRVKKLFREMKRFEPLPDERTYAGAVSKKVDAKRILLAQVQTIAEQLLDREFAIKPNVNYPAQSGRSLEE